jgi:hypothetical protein
MTQNDRLHDADVAPFTTISGCIHRSNCDILGWCGSGPLLRQRHIKLYFSQLVW